MEAKFSVIIPTFNRVSTLGRAIESVRSQTFPAWEIIVVDDGSSDRTQELLKSYPKVIYHYQVNSGVCAARNQGAKMATGDWLVFLDSDDKIENNALEIFGNHIKFNPEPQIFAGGFRKVFSNASMDTIPNKLSEFIPLSGTYCVKKASFLSVGGFDSNLTFSENTELFHRFKLNGFVVKLIPKVFLVYFQNQNGGNNNRSNQISALEYICSIHKKSLSIDQLFTYNQILGVLYLRDRNFKNAKEKFFFALKYKPYRVDTILRLFISSIPSLSIQIYK